YAEAIEAGRSPAAGREVLDAPTRALERVLLEVRVRDGLPTSVLGGQGRRAVAGLLADGLVEPGPALRRVDARVVLTRRGRLLADAVVRALTP
ncbi:MAG: coproporphyrinogen III oxidase, partial [Cellulomonas sp.]|nr:coproporphyrinogen III oxidase [Cellulomonas sp.]